MAGDHPAIERSDICDKIRPGPLLVGLKLSGYIWTVNLRAGRRFTTENLHELDVRGPSLFGYGSVAEAAAQRASSSIEAR